MIKQLKSINKIKSEWLEEENQTYKVYTDGPIVFFRNGQLHSVIAPVEFACFEKYIDVMQIEDDEYDFMNQNGLFKKNWFEFSKLDLPEELFEI